MFGRCVILLLPLLLLVAFILLSVSTGGTFAQQAADRCPPFANATNESYGSGLFGNDSSSFSVPCGDLEEGQRLNEGLLPGINYYCRNYFTPYLLQNCTTPSCSVCREAIACQVPARSLHEDVCASDVLLSCSGLATIPQLDDLYGGLCRLADSACLANSSTGVCESQTLLQVCVSVEIYTAVWPCDCFLPNGTCQLCGVVRPLCPNVTITDGSGFISGSGSGSGSGGGFDLCDFANSGTGSGYPFLCAMIQPDSPCQFTSETCIACSYLHVLGCSYSQATLADVCAETSIVQVCDQPSIAAQSSYFIDLCAAIVAGGGCPGNTTGDADFCNYFLTEDGIGYLFLCQLIGPYNDGTAVCPFSNETCEICYYLSLSGCTFPNVTMADICAQPRLVGVCESLSIDNGTSAFFTDICSYIVADGCESNDTCVGPHCHICGFLASESGLSYVFLCQALPANSTKCPYSNTTCGFCDFISSGVCPNLPVVGYSELCSLSSLVYHCRNYIASQYQAGIVVDPFFSDICPFTSECVATSGSGSGSGSGFDSGSGSGFGSGSGSGGGGVTCADLEQYFTPGLVYYCSSPSFNPENCTDEHYICTLCNFVLFCPNTTTTIPTTTEVCSSLDTISICFVGEKDFNDYCSEVMSLCLADMDSGVCEQEVLIENCTALLAVGDFICNTSEFAGICDICLSVLELCAITPEMTVSTFPSPSLFSAQQTFDVLPSSSSSFSSSTIAANSSSRDFVDVSVVSTIGLVSTTTAIFEPIQTSSLSQSSNLFTVLTSSAIPTVGIGPLSSLTGMPITSSLMSSTGIGLLSTSSSLPGMPISSSAEFTTVLASTVQTVSIEGFPSTAVPPLVGTTSTEPGLPSSSRAVPSPSPSPSSSPVSSATYPEGTAVEVDQLDKEQEENTISIEMSGLTVAVFVIKEESFRISIATALNNNIEQTTGRRRRRQNDEFTANDVMFVGEPVTTAKGAVLVAFFVERDDVGVVRGDMLFDVVNKNIMDIGDSTGGKVTAVEKGVPQALQPEEPSGGTSERDNGDGGGGGLSGGAVVAIVVLVVIVSLLGVAVIVGLLWLVARRRQKRSFEMITGAGDYTDMEQSEEEEEDGAREAGKTGRTTFPLKGSSYVPVPGAAFSSTKDTKDDEEEEEEEKELGAKVTHL